MKASRSAPGRAKRRVFDYSAELADEICDRLADGESLKEICDADDMPSRATLYRWLDRHPEFARHLDYARDELADALGKKIVAIADRAKNVPLARLKIDARRQRAHLLALRRFARKADPVDDTYPPMAVNINLGHEK
jgi:hypothetical protein